MAPNQSISGVTDRRFKQVLWVSIAVTFVFALLRFDGPAKGYWDTYITAPAMFMNGDPIEFTKEGKALYPIELEGILPKDLKNTETYGIISKDQRIGAGITSSVPYASFGILGFRILFALCISLLIPMTVLIMRRLRPEAYWAGLLAGIALAWNPFVLSVDRLNANLLVLPLILLLLDLCLRREVPWIWVGVTLGLIAGLRNAAICFVPALTIWAIWGVSATDWRERIGRLFKIGAMTLVMMVPIFIWKQYAFGDPFIHSSQYPHFQGFRPEFAHSLLGLEFQFNGLFNWPLHDELVRTPHFAYPTYLLFPLVTLRAFGWLLCAVMLFGFIRQWRSERKQAVFLSLWCLGVYALFGPQENWEEVKMTFMLLAYPPIIVWLALGLHAFIEGVDRPRRLAVLGLLSLWLVLSIKLATFIDVPVDQRWYVRFPKAAPSAQGVQAGIVPEERNDTVYFLAHETPEEIALERNKLTAAWPWPSIYLPMKLDFAREISEVWTEQGKTTLTIPAVWDDIYAQHQ
jgi:4-amino-4-deoxy-L-arabinose transferase-like glycosyltransferase